jgi:hypothetical protein
MLLLSTSAMQTIPSRASQEKRVRGRAYKGGI